jgi:hypothetical protein
MKRAPRRKPGVPYGVYDVLQPHPSNLPSLPKSGAQSPRATAPRTKVVDIGVRAVSEPWLSNSGLQVKLP